MKVYILCVQNVHHGIRKYNFPLINTRLLSPSDTSMGDWVELQKKLLGLSGGLLNWSSYPIKQCQLYVNE